MEQQQTAMQRLIEMTEGFCNDLEAKKKDYPQWPEICAHFDKFILGANSIKGFAEQQLEQERRQLKKAFNDGEANVWDRHRDENHFEFEDAQDYLNKTFVNLNKSL